MQLRAKVGSETNIPIGVARSTPMRPILLRAAADVAYLPAVPERRLIERQRPSSPREGRRGQLFPGRTAVYDRTTSAGRSGCAR